MIKEFEFFYVNGADGLDASLVGNYEYNGAKVYTFKLTWTENNAKNNDAFKFRWMTPMIDYIYKWGPLCGSNKSIGPDFSGLRGSSLASNAPMECVCDFHDKNKYTYALSECAKEIGYRGGVHEESGDLIIDISLGVAQYTGLFETELSIYVDTRYIPRHEAVDGVVKWWENKLGMTAAYVPDEARNAAYSFWYSYHQDMTDAEVEAECKRAHELGFDVCIIDDGWQTDDNNRGYAFCGDWEPTPSKFPDMAAHVANVHALGMKYMLWYSMPFVGYESKNFEKFKDMALRHDTHLKTIIVDPRYREVREFLKSIYKKAVVDWNLDGLKLDFVDQWCYNSSNAPYNPKMDTVVLQDAVDKLMVEIMTELKEIKPNILLEFRQCYIGPYMRKYGNMFRVGDCPNDYIHNRVGVLDLRQHMGNSAVHSDMLMWHKDEKVETAAVQIINVLFGVLQYSAKLEGMNDDMKMMSKFWLSFMKEHKKLLLEAPVFSYEPDKLYTWAKTTLDNECAVGVYSIDKCVSPDAVDTVYIANGTAGERVIADIAHDYSAKIYNCKGEVVLDNVNLSAGVTVINVPSGGLAVLTK